MIVVDASAAVAFIVDSGQVGEFLAATISANEVAFPSLMPYEVASALRRLCSSGALAEPVARRALSKANMLHGLTFEFEELAQRVWQLRENVSPYDAAYVALAELIDAPLLTLDRRLASAPDPQCRFLLPPIGS